MILGSSLRDIWRHPGFYTIPEALEGRKPLVQPQKINKEGSIVASNLIVNPKYCLTTMTSFRESIEGVMSYHSVPIP
jgi:hypothetical protein